MITTIVDLHDCNCLEAHCANRKYDEKFRTYYCRLGICPVNNHRYPSREQIQGSIESFKEYEQSIRGEKYDTITL